MWTSLRTTVVATTATPFAAASVAPMDDLYGNVPQPTRSPPPIHRKPLTSQDIREQMLTLIESVRAAEQMPFAPDELEKHRAMFPIMAQWLEPADGEQLVLQFEAEVARLRQAA